MRMGPPMPLGMPRVTDKDHLQAKRASSVDVGAAPGVEAAARVAGHGGVPLSAETRNFFEPRFGHDFSQVRVHADGPAESAARAVRACAYTHGRHIVFGSGEYAPGTTEGKRLLAHELAHVVQQGAAHGAPPRIHRQSKPQDGPGPVTEAVGDVSVSVGQTMTAEAGLRAVYEKGAKEITEEALRMVASGQSPDEAARWANQARNELKASIRARGSPVTKALAEARNIKKYGDKIGPSYDDLIRKGKTPNDIIGSAGKADTKVTRAATRIKVAGRLLIAIDIAIVTWEVIEAPEGEGLKTAVAGVGGIAGALAGGWAGAKGGAALGGGIGSLFGPGPGTGIGAGIGGFIGGIGGALVGGFAGREGAKELYEVAESIFAPDFDKASAEIDAQQDAVIRGRKP
ncbi:DUF4157 domain-containing protein [Corallococcus sp. AB049A]|nr:DUF4157 domain-containing protein [Corallococcus sp. AB049A]